MKTLFNKVTTWPGTPQDKKSIKEKRELAGSFAFIGMGLGGAFLGLPIGFGLILGALLGYKSGQICWYGFETKQKERHEIPKLPPPKSQ